MSTTSTVRVVGVVLVCAFLSAADLNAQLSVGTWVKKAAPGEMGAISMTIEMCCNGGRRIAYHLKGRQEVLMTIDSALDGSDAPVMIAGKPSGETMGIKRLDDHRVVTVLKMNGTQFGVSHATISDDGRTLMVENEITASGAGRTPGKTTETWIKQ
jgi:hypothetical protein